MTFFSAVSWAHMSAFLQGGMYVQGPSMYYFYTSACIELLTYSGLIGLHATGVHTEYLSLLPC